MERIFNRPERREVPVITQYADEASKLVRDKQIIRLTDAIAHVLDIHHVVENRAAVYSQIASELGARGARKKAMGGHTGETIRSIQAGTLMDDARIEEDLRRAEMFRDAHAHERAQPASAWNPDHPENSP